MNGHPVRGEVWWIGQDPTVGSEVKKTRPCVVISSFHSRAGRLAGRSLEEVVLAVGLCVDAPGWAG